jgi:phospholipid/cholesterol/gamma-HCH transport system substrate-binding protein
MKRTKRGHVATVLGGLVFSVALLVGLMYFAGFWRAGSSYNISAYVYNARGIAQDSTVFEAGLPVGLVTGVQRHGPDAILSLRIDHGPTPIPRDSQIELNLRSLAGEADVVLVLGHSQQTVRNGGSLGLQQDQSYTEVDQILNQFAGPTEGKARQFFQGVGAGVQGEGQNLNQTLGGFADLVNNSPPLTSTLSAQHNQVADIVQNFGNIMGAIGQRTQAIDQFAQGALTTFNDVAARDVAMEKGLSELKYTVGGNWSAVRSVRFNAPTIIPVIDNLASAAIKLKPALDLLNPASVSGIKLVRALGGASPALKNVLVNLAKLQPSTAKAMPALHAIDCQLDPIARFLAPYGGDIAAFFQSFGGADDMYQTNGAHQLIASLLVDPSSFFRGVETQPNVNSLLTTLFNYGIFQKAGGTEGFHGLVPPGDIASLTYGGANNDNGPIQWGAGHPYPHVTQDCAS